MNPAEIFIDHALGLEWANLPQNVQAAAKTFLHDSLGVGVAGAKAPYADALYNVVTDWGRGGACSVLGRPGVRLPAPSAAFINAFQIHSQEFDCVHEPAVLHPMATVVAAVMAEVERSGPYRGADVLAAIVGGVDVAVALGVAVSTPLKFFRPATAGIFGCVAALSRLKRLPRETALDALGYALAFASGTMQAHVEGKPALPIQVGNAARGAVAAIDIAEAQIPGPRHGIDGPFGYLTLFENAYDLGPVVASLGRVFRITELSWKPFPTGRAAQGAIVALQTLMREQGVTADNLVKFTYTAPPLIKRLVGRPVVDGMQPAYARLCLPWLAAVVLTKGTVGLDDFAPRSLGDSALRALSDKVSVEVGDNLDPADFVPAVAAARLTDDRHVQVAVDVQLGSPAWPLSRAQHLDKAAACLAFGGLGAVHDALTRDIAGFDSLEDAATVFRLAAGA